MTLSPLAGLPAPTSLLVDLSRLEKDYSQQPDPSVVSQQVSFGTSGHRGSSSDASFTEAHILAITQAICDYRVAQKITGPLFIGKDTHALSAPAQRSALEVLAANGVTTIVQSDDGFTPTPVISHAILGYNRTRYANKNGLADGIVITPSHNPPQDGGFKYNPPNGGPADTDATGWIQDRANQLLREKNKSVSRMAYEGAIGSANVEQRDLSRDYINDLGNIVDLESIKNSKLKIGVDPLGGASVRYWPLIAERFAIPLDVVNTKVDPQFAFMTVDHDGKIRMDCSSPYAMASLVHLKDKYDVAFGNDPDSDRHGIVTPLGLMNPNHYLAVAIQYLLSSRSNWRKDSVIGKTLVSSSMIDRVVASLDRKLAEVPVGFKWFVQGLFDGSYCFGGEESAGASFLRFDGSVWSTDKDGIILNLLAAEITAKTGKNPGLHYQELTKQFGDPLYTRIDAPANAEQKDILKKLSPTQVTASKLAGEEITAKLTKAPANDAAIGGLKVTTQNGWFAARPSGTEEIYKIYAESFKNQEHLDLIVTEAEAIVSAALKS